MIIAVFYVCQVIMRNYYDQEAKKLEDYGAAIEIGCGNQAFYVGNLCILRLCTFFFCRKL